VNLQVTRLNGQTDSLANAFTFTVPVSVNLPLAGGTPLTATDVRRAISGLDNYAVDRDGDGLPELPLFPFPDLQTGELAVGFDSTETLMGIRCRDAVFPKCNVEVTRDSDADFDLADQTGVFLEQLTATTGRILAPSLVFDPSGRPVAGYIKSNGPATAVVAHDRDGDGLFTGTNERVDVAGTAASNSRSEAAVDPSGRVALVYFNDTGDTIRVAWDRSGDGDYVDTVGGNPEASTLVTLTGPPVCLGAGFAPDGDLAVVWDTGTSGPNLARDLNADGDFADPNEVVSLSGSPSTACDAHGMDGFPLAVAHNAGGTLELLVDRNDDADFADADEVIFLDGGVSPTRAAVARSQTGRTFVATSSPNVIYEDPTP
jgi:hypothetical protein